MDLVIGMDIGGTKTHLLVEDPFGRTVADQIISSGSWSASPVAQAGAWIAREISDLTATLGTATAVGVGAQGVNDQQHGDAIGQEMAGLLQVPVVVTNDADLLIPAAGLTAGIGVIAGTGSIAVGRLPSGSLTFAGGWGWVLGDEGSAPGLVREAVRAALRANEQADSDVLLPLLLGSFGVTDPNELARLINDNPRAEAWGPAAPVVFQAADEGSAIAREVVQAAAKHLTELVSTLSGRGAASADVVTAGSVMTFQRRLFDAFRAELSEALPLSRLHLLAGSPARGAVVLARRALATGQAVSPDTVVPTEWSRR